MTKRELMARLNELIEEKGMHRLDGVNWSSNKSEIENAIKCMECSDEQMDEYLIVIKLKYPATYQTIKSNGDYRVHPFNRLYVYNTARLVLSD